MVDKIDSLIEYSKNSNEFLKAKTTKNGRVYLTPDGKSYPSVTTIIDKCTDKSHLDSWRKRIGEDEAKKITVASAKRGTGLHLMLEDFFSGKEVQKRCEVSQKLYKKVETLLPRFKPIVLECPLFSEVLRVAGRCDFIGYYNNTLSIVDFKTSIKQKEIKWLDNYFIQEAFYSMMLYDMFKIECKQLVLLISVEVGFPQIVKKEISEYASKVIKYSKNYHSKFNSSSPIV